MNFKTLISSIALSAMAGGALATPFADKVNAALDAYQGDVATLVNVQENLENERINYILNGGTITLIDGNGNPYDAGTLVELTSYNSELYFENINHVEAWLYTPGWYADANGQWYYQSTVRYDVDLDTHYRAEGWNYAEVYGTGGTIQEAIIDLAAEVFEDGFEQGYEIGFQDGYEQGYVDGYIDGYGDGLAAQ